MSKFKNKKLWKNIGIGCLAGALCIGAVAGIGALANKAEETTKIINPSYAVGGLTEQGQYLETKESIYTKDAFACQGLDIEIDFDNNISYRIFFYDADNDFLTSTGKLQENYDETTTPIEARYARVVITPDDDDKISWFEKSGYANQIEISVNKEQKDVEIPYKGSDKFVYLQGYTASNYGTGLSTIEIAKAETTDGYNLSDVVDTTGCSTICIKVDKTLLSSVKITQLSQTAKLSSNALDTLDYDETFFNGNTYITFALNEDCEGIFLIADPTIDFSNFGIYVW